MEQLRAVGELNLLETYETLFPRCQYKINSSNKFESSIEKQYYLKQLMGNSK